MPTVENIAVVCGAGIAVITFAGLLWKCTRAFWRGLSRMFKLSRQVLRQAHEFFVKVNGDAEHLPMMEVLNETLAVSRDALAISQDNAKRITRVEQGLADLQGHRTPGPISVPFGQRRKRT